MAEKKLENELAKDWDVSLIRYSRVIEDHRVLSKGLQVKKDEDIIISITSAGDNVLNLLLDEPKQIIAVDMSPAQNALLELKIAAINILDYGDYLVLLGEKEGDQVQRLKIFEKVRSSLPAYAKDYWDHNHAVLIEGVSSSGRLQKYSAALFEEHLSTVVSIEEIDRFMGAGTLEEQRSLFNQLPLEKMKKIHSEYLSHSSQASKARSAGQLKYVKQTDDEIAEEMWSRFCKVSREIPMTDNFYHGWWLRGKRIYDPEINPKLAPPYLTKDGFTTLKALVDRVVVFTGTIESYLVQNPSLKFTKANFSDIFEYMTEEDSDKLFVCLSDHIESGGRMVFWNLFNTRLPPDGCKLTVLKEESQELREIDRIYFYTSPFVVAKK